MATTAASYQDVAKEVWDSDTMVKQFYDENPWLDRLEKVQRVVIGKRAQVPIHRGRAGGTTVLDSAGGVINAADGEDTDQAQYTLSYNYFPVSIETGAMNEISGGPASVGDALEHMMTSGIANIRNQITRQMLTGHGRIAQAFTDGGGDAVVNLTTRAQASSGEVSGADAIAMGWIVPGDVVDVGTSGVFNSLTSAFTDTQRTVVAVDEVSAQPSMTLGANVAASGTTHFVNLVRSRGAAGNGTLRESAGLATIAGAVNNTVGTIDANVDKYWNPSEVDTTTTLPDLELLLRLSRKVARRTGKGATFLLTSLLQLDNIYQMLQSQVRFAGDKEIGAGASESVKWRGMDINAFPQVPENVLYFLDMDSLEIVVGKYQKPTWMSDIGGGGKAGHWVPGTTRFDDTVMYALGLAARRRNSMAAAVNLSA